MCIHHFQMCHFFLNISCLQPQTLLSLLFPFLVMLIHNLCLDRKQREWASVLKCNNKYWEREKSKKGIWRLPSLQTACLALGLICASVCVNTPSMDQNFHNSCCWLAVFVLLLLFLSWYVTSGKMVYTAAEGCKYFPKGGCGTFSSEGRKPTMRKCRTSWGPGPLTSL